MIVPPFVFLKKGIILATCYSNLKLTTVDSVKLNSNLESRSTKVGKNQSENVHSFISQSAE